MKKKKWIESHSQINKKQYYMNTFADKPMDERSDSGSLEIEENGFIRYPLGTVP